MNYLLEYFFNSDGFLKKEEMILGLVLSAMSLVNPKLRKFNNGISIVLHFRCGTFPMNHY